MPIDSLRTAAAAPDMPTPSKTANPKKIQESAKQFEALMIDQLLQTSHILSSAIGEDEDPNSTIAELGQQQFAQALAARGGLGIAKMIVVGLSKDANR